MAQRVLCFVYRSFTDSSCSDTSFVAALNDPNARLADNETIACTLYTNTDHTELAKYIKLTVLNSARSNSHLAILYYLM
jgi:hypothetical protein